MKSAFVDNVTVFSPMNRSDVFHRLHYQDLLCDVILAEKPGIFVMTGIESGFTSEWLLEAMDRVGRGHLYVLDGAPGGMFVQKPIVHPRFTLIKKHSVDGGMEDLFQKLGPWDMFLHESDHEEACQTFEYEAAWRMVRSGGIIASDDTGWGNPPHHAWDKFIARHGVTATAINNAFYFKKP